MQSSTKKIKELSQKSKGYDASLGDRAWIVTGILDNIPIYTEDKIWLDAKIKKVDIRLIPQLIYYQI